MTRENSLELRLLRAQRLQLLSESLVRSGGVAEFVVNRRGLFLRLAAALGGSHLVPLSSAHETLYLLPVQLGHINRLFSRSTKNDNSINTTVTEAMRTRTDENAMRTR